MHLMKWLALLQELIAEEAANRKDIEDVIEEERAKVDAKTQITEEVFRNWRQKNIDDRKKAAETSEAERKKKGVMTGREIFAQVDTSLAFPGKSCSRSSKPSAHIELQADKGV